MKKAWKIAIATVIGTLLLGSSALAGGDWNGFPLANVRVNGAPLQSDVPPVVIGGRTMLPVRAVADAVGAKVAWDQQTQTVDLLTDNSANKQATDQIAQLQQQVTSLQAQVPKGPSAWILSKDQVEAAAAYGRQFPKSADLETMFPGYVYELMHPFSDLAGYGMSLEIATPWRNVATRAYFQATTPTLKQSSLDDLVAYANAGGLDGVFVTALGADAGGRQYSVDLKLSQNGQVISPTEYSSTNRIRGNDNIIVWGATFPTGTLQRNLPITLIATVHETPAGRWDGKTSQATWDLASLK